MTDISRIWEFGRNRAWGRCQRPPAQPPSAPIGRWLGGSDDGARSRARDARKAALEADAKAKHQVWSCQGVEVAVFASDAGGSCNVKASGCAYGIAGPSSQGGPAVGARPARGRAVGWPGGRESGRSGNRAVGLSGCPWVVGRAGGRSDVPAFGRSPWTPKIAELPKAPCRALLELGPAPVEFGPNSPDWGNT